MALARPLREAAGAVLLTAGADAKAAAARALWQDWTEGRILVVDAGPPLPDRPARPARPLLLPPAQMPRRGRAGSPRSRFALLHALAHIELNAIDLALDMAARWGPALPPAFTRDWLRVADEEARHFSMLAALLAGDGGAYGELPAHDGLWAAAQATQHDLLARLAVVPMVLEARGLDVTPAMIARFEAAGDHSAAEVLALILRDEIGHVETGTRWFRQLCSESVSEPVSTFRHLVQSHFTGAVKPPFNDSARLSAGLTTDWYVGLGPAVSAFKP
jgi:uncharacterized ferritin-like protein (DUF455 family)